MKKISLLILILFICLFSQAQNKKTNNIDLSNRANDHIMLQLSNDSWIGAPDSINTHISGIGRGFNGYFMIDKPFRTNPHLSIGFGAGISTSNIFFKDMVIENTATTATLKFTETDSTGSYKKYKLTTAYIEAPIEIRYSSSPENSNKSIKAAIGIKVGTPINAHTKGKLLRTSSGQNIVDGIEKESSKRYFNSTRIALTARVNYGIFGLFGSYSLSPLFKNGVASQNTKVLQVGLMISGL